MGAGATRASRERPIFFIARHTAPTFPGSVVRDKTITTSDRSMLHFTGKNSILSKPGTGKKRFLGHYGSKKDRAI
jgi:hypothetical protein